MANQEKEKEYYKAVGSVIRSLRQQYTDKSLCMFAYENDIPRSTLSRIEQGQSECGVVALKKIANGFNWSVSELFAHIESNLGEDFNLIDE